MYSDLRWEENWESLIQWTSLKTIYPNEKYFLLLLTLLLVVK